MNPARGQVWRFCDGREGTVASVNSIGTTVYVGPQAITIPAGDVDLVFGRAILQRDVYTSPAPTALVSVLERSAPKTSENPSPPTPAVDAEPEQPPHLRPPPSPAQSIEMPASRRGRKRQRDAEV